MDGENSVPGANRTNEVRARKESGRGRRECEPNKILAPVPNSLIQAMQKWQSSSQRCIVPGA